MCKYTVREGKGSVVHRDGIEHSDIEKLYTSMVFSVHTPTDLLNKVWFELCLHFCRRGKENQRELTPQMFAIETDNLVKMYICLDNAAATDKSLIMFPNLFLPRGRLSYQMSSSSSEASGKDFHTSDVALTSI
jgi:hypothetical protein